MTITKTDIKFILPFVIFVGLGLWGSYHFDFREDKGALALTMRWCFLPSLVLGGLYAYYGGYKRAPAQAIWRKYVGVLCLTVITTLLFLRSFQGFVFIINSNFGVQSQLLVSGIISKVEKPKKKKVLNSYTIYVKNKNAQELVLDVPGTDWEKGDKFEKLLYKGSFGLLYGK